MNRGRPNKVARGKKTCSCKTCKHKGKSLALDAFSWNEARQAWSSWCRDCQNAYARKWRKRRKRAGN